MILVLYLLLPAVRPWLLPAPGAEGRGLGGATGGPEGGHCTVGAAGTDGSSGTSGAAGTVGTVGTVCSKM